MLLKLALRNLIRQRTRTGITFAAIVFGVAALIVSGGFIKDLFIQLGEAIIHSQTGHIQVFPKGFLEKGSRQPERFLIDNPSALKQRLLLNPEIIDVAARLNFSGLLNNGKRDLAIIGEGVEPEKEAKLGSLLQISAGRKLAETDKFGLLAGQGVAHALGLEPGDTVTLMISTTEGALNTIDLQLVGVFQSFSKDYDARAIKIPLGAAQELLSSAGANLLVVSLQQTNNTDLAYSKIQQSLANSELDAVTWRKLSDFYDKSVQLYDRQFGVLQFIILLMVLLSVINSVNMSTFERLGEFGTLQAVGTKPAVLFKQLLLEGLILGSVGSSAGVTVGIIAALSISLIGIPMPPPPNANVGYTAHIQIVPEVIAAAFVIGLTATFCASVLPARRALRLPIVDALRQSI